MRNYDVKCEISIINTTQLIFFRWFYVNQPGLIPIKLTFDCSSTPTFFIVSRMIRLTSFNQNLIYDFGGHLGLLVFFASFLTWQCDGNKNCSLERIFHCVMSELFSRSVLVIESYLKADTLKSLKLLFERLIFMMSLRKQNKFMSLRKQCRKKRR